MPDSSPRGAPTFTKLLAARVRILAARVSTAARSGSVSAGPQGRVCDQRILAPSQSLDQLVTRGVPACMRAYVTRQGTQANPRAARQPPTPAPVTHASEGVKSRSKQARRQPLAVLTPTNVPSSPVSAVCLTTGCGDRRRTNRRWYARSSLAQRTRGSHARVRLGRDTARQPGAHLLRSLCSAKRAG